MKHTHTHTHTQTHLPPAPPPTPPPDLEPGLPSKHAALVIDPPLIIKHRHKRQAVALPRGKVVGVVRGRDLDGARPKRHVHELGVGHDGQLAPVQRVQDVGADEGLVAGVVGVDCNRRVAQHRFRPRRRHHNLALPTFQRVRKAGQHAKLDGVCVTRHLDLGVGGDVDVVDLDVRNRSFELSGPVDQPVRPVHFSRLVQPQKSFLHRRRQLGVHGERLARPVGRRADAPQLATNGPPILVHPLVHLGHERVAAQVAASDPLFTGQRFFDDGLGGDAGVVCAWHPQRRAPPHAGPPHDGILDGRHQSMAQVKGPGDVRGRNHHDKGWVRAPVGRRFGREKVAGLPPRVCGRLHIFWVVHFGGLPRVVFFDAGGRGARRVDEGREFGRIGRARGLFFRFLGGFLGVKVGAGGGSSSSSRGPGASFGELGVLGGAFGVLCGGWEKGRDERQRGVSRRACCPLPRLPSPQIRRSFARTR